MSTIQHASRILISAIFVVPFVVTVVQAEPDLELVSLRLYEINYSPHRRIDVRYSVKNWGDVHRTGSIVTFYLSDDTTITSDDVTLGTRADVCPDAGKTYNLRLLQTFQEGEFPPGEYYLGAIVSCPGDTNLENNTLHINTPISYDGSDLTMESMALNDFSTFEWGGEVWSDFCVKNVGLRASRRYNIYFYASLDTTISDSDHRLAIYGGGSEGLLSGEARCQRKQLKFDNLPQGDYYVGAIIDCETDFDDLSNNVHCSSGTFSIAPAPDLSVKHVRAESGSFCPGDTISLYDGVVENKGYGISGRYTVDYYASTDRDVEPSDYHIGRKSCNPLNVGEEKNFARSCKFPDDMPDDDYYIGVIVTCEDDFDLENNHGVDSGSVWVGLSADFAVQSVQVTPGAYAPDETWAIYSLIENIGGRNSKNYSVDYYASTDTHITKEDYLIGGVDRTLLAAGDKDSYETVYRVPYSIPAGHYYIGLIVTSKDEYDPANNIGRTSAWIELVHPAGYLCGHVQYEYLSTQHQRFSNLTFPVRFATVQIFEDDHNNDSLDDLLVGQTFTDPNGNYGIILSDDENREYDIYIRVLTEGVSGDDPDTMSKICRLQDDVFYETYARVSASYPHPRHGSVVINMTAPDEGEFLVFDSIVEGYSKAKTFLGVEPNEISVYWPCEAGLSYFDPCEMGIYISQDDRRDRDVIMHEYGHYVAHPFGVGVGPVGDNPVHYWDGDLREEPVFRIDEHAMNLAFREAWASLFSIATQYGDIRYPFSGDSKYTDMDEESDKAFTINLDNDGAAEFSPGQYFENMNAGALWDIFEDIDTMNNWVDGDDISNGPSLSMIWAISRDYQPDNIIGFWNSWFQDYDYEQEMKGIFEAHEMPFVKPGP